MIHHLSGIQDPELLPRREGNRADGPAGGRIVLLTSGQHRGPMAREIAYAASKGALHQVTASLAEAVAARGITVNTVNPGPTDTGWADAAEEAIVRKRMPFGRWGTPDDFKGPAVFLASDASQYVHGTILLVDGGWMGR